MTNDTNNTQILRTAGETATLLKIKESTLRKYCIELENAGHKFYKSARGHRAYANDDITILQRFITTKNAPNMTLQRSAEAVVKAHTSENVRVDVTEDQSLQKRHNNDITELKKTVEKQNELLQALMKKMDQQQEYIDKRLGERNDAVTQSLREVQETKQLIAAAKQAEEESKQKRGFFARLFGK
ncbi:hypothetical protein AB685_21895 [Bacillus sp. LL01]|uniref:DUF3967 domain-containing protein n=1 Tax=Bacillus sp. LL01 TaxID=1665556 RepID=UPI00064D1A4C|nr:DUF3967 domain-containing protein [Bacillus sp. LL01]KMJ56442.1 hypothetical protein AB685_21895 [Bacillus sp. LL01]